MYPIKGAVNVEAVLHDTGMTNSAKKPLAAGTAVITSCPLCGERIERRVVIGSTHLRISCPCGQEWALVIHLGIGGSVRTDWTML